FLCFYDRKQLEDYYFLVKYYNKLIYNVGLIK
ncbi:unnamed protein product, partial [marine sediment metagenome]